MSALGHRHVFLLPRGDAAAQVVHLAETGAGELRRAAAARDAGVAIDDDGLAGIQLRRLVTELGERDVAGIDDVAGAIRVMAAYVDELRARVDQAHRFQRTELLPGAPRAAHFTDRD